MLFFILSDIKYETNNVANKSTDAKPKNLCLCTPSLGFPNMFEYLQSDISI